MEKVIKIILIQQNINLVKLMKPMVVGLMTVGFPGLETSFHNRRNINTII
jgi:hypothetical protein